MPSTPIPSGPAPALFGDGSDAQRFSLKRDTIQHPAAIAWADRTIFAELVRWRAAWLSPYELAGYNNCGIEKRRMDYLLGRLAAKLAIYTLLQEPESALQSSDSDIDQPRLSQLRSIEIALGAFTQPLARAPQGGGVASSNNISPAVCYAHSDGVAVALAFPDGHPLGVDLEVVAERRVKMLKTQINDTELAGVLPSVYAGSSAPNVAEGMVVPTETDAYTQAWCAKEALSKILRCGLTVPFEVLALKNTRVVSSPVPRLEGEFKNFTQYRFESLTVGRFAFSLVLPRRTTAAWPSEWLCERLEASAPTDTTVPSVRLAPRPTEPAADPETTAALT
ncbi:MAG: 4'-phosphopantetheinyl transferase superfamily protein [Candidatus Methylacidiphilales bacterium]|nr:4'-phosphopantetheinyl transferase superfamily protein [Candidatus Methylacidiphilales bacterium]